MRNLMLIALVVLGSLGTTFGQTTIAHVDSQKVLDTMPSRKQAMQELDNFEDKAVKELQETQQKLQDDYNKLQQEKNTMSPTAARFEEERLMRKSQEFQMRQEELDRQMKVLGQELNAPILERIQSAVEKVSKSLKIDYVLDTSSLLYSAGKDITDLVIKEVLKMEQEATVKTEK
ncbi:MAG: OmpH family outer membrane protein [Brumimicrobium sp.]|nr:OmpH family outer membrane protein [Brumimicrobium sp.]MCO5268006.1 OmpH family outer membrane protein [Brumimicrobium sp.]